MTADDFIAGFQHMLDAKGGLEYLVQGIVKNASEYIYGEITELYLKLFTRKEKEKLENVMQ